MKLQIYNWILLLHTLTSSCSKLYISHSFHTVVADVHRGKYDYVYISCMSCRNENFCYIVLGWNNLKTRLNSFLWIPFVSDFQPFLIHGW